MNNELNNIKLPDSCKDLPNSIKQDIQKAIAEAQTPQTDRAANIEKVMAINGITKFNDLAAILAIDRITLYKYKNYKYLSKPVINKIELNIKELLN